MEEVIGLEGQMGLEQRRSEKRINTNVLNNLVK